jgi:hypothetical protein
VGAWRWCQIGLSAFFGFSRAQGVLRMASVKVGPEFFVKELREYSDWRWAFIREAFQNSIDAPGSSLINVSISEADGKTTIVWQNNGQCMSRETIEDKLFSLGGTGKEFNGTVGGFGKAKILLYFAHASYTIRSGYLEVVGRGGEYEIREVDDYLDGTCSTVVVNGCERDKLESFVWRFSHFGQWHGTILCNDTKYSPSMWKGSPRREFSFGTVYTNKLAKNLMVVRIGGIPMFIKYVSVDRCVVVELSGSSVDRLTSNRDDLLSEYSRELQGFVNELAVDKKSALKKRVESKKTVFEGRSYYHLSAASLQALKTPSAALSSNSGTDEAPAGPKEAEVQGKAKERAEAEREFASQLSHRFVILNKTGLNIPDHLMPNSNRFSAYSRKLATMWGKVMLQMHVLFDKTDAFSVGFVFDNDEESAAVALYESDPSKVYYINPVKKNFKKRFKLTDRDSLIAYAAHEFTHGLGYCSHDEDYTCKFTEVVAKVLAHRKSFNRCFR